MRILILAVCTAIGGAVGISAQAVRAEEPRRAPKQLVQTLNAAVEQWLSDVEFKSTYELIQGRSRTLEAALRGEMNEVSRSPNGEPYVTRGVFHKMGDSVRMSKQYSTGPVKVNQDGNSASWTNLDSDEVASGPLRAMKVPAFVGKNGRITVDKRPLDGNLAVSSGNLIAGPMSKYELSPLSIVGGVVQVPLQLKLQDNEDVNDVTASTEDVDEEHIAVTLTYQGTERTKTLRVEFWTTVSPPVVTRIHRVTEYKNGERSVRAATASDFVQCSGGMVAKKVCYASTSDRESDKEFPWSVRVWESTDLGAVAPNKEDFVLPVKEGTVVSGLRAPPTGSNKAIDLSQLGVQDIGHDAIRVTDLTTDKTDPKTKWLLWLNLTFLSLAIIVFAIRRQRAKRA